MSVHNETLVPPHCHSISFFRDDAQLCQEIAAFVQEGLAQDEPALIVTNLAHRTGIARALSSSGTDVDAAASRGDLLMVDAEETLATLMPHGMIDDEIYHRNVGSVVGQLLRGRPGPVRIFGDMVDLLWQREDFENAIRIELLSNQLAVLQPISVICGYSMGHFLKTAAKLDVVRRLHGRMHVPHDSTQANAVQEPGAAAQIR